ncbi:hypothetical protein ACHAXR_004159 [Thalassiosira sp. AJA248-18]
MAAESEEPWLWLKHNVLRNKGEFVFRSRIAPGYIRYYAKMNQARLLHYCMKSKTFIGRFGSTIHNWEDVRNQLTVAMLQSYCAHLGGTANRDGSRYDSLWEENFAALLLYKQKHGDCRVPNRSSEYPKLGRWVNTQRVAAKAGVLSDDRQERLVRIGFDFDPDNSFWEEQFAALVRYKQKHGDCMVPRVYSEDPQLGTWVNNQRVRAGKLSDERRERLESIGFSLGMKP